MKKICFVCFAQLTILFVYAQTDTSLISVTDMLKIKQVNAVTLSKDGSNAAFTVTIIEPDGDNKWEYKYTSHIFMMPANGSQPPRQLTTAVGASQPVWSPDGKQLAFVRAVEGRPQIFLLSLEGGEPVQLTKYKYGASTPRWSPDGSKIAFSSSVSLSDLLKDSLLNAKKSVPGWSSEKPGFDKNNEWLSNTAKPDPNGSLEEIRAYLNNNVADKKAKVINKLNFQQEASVSSDITFDYLFITNAERGAIPVAVTKGFYSFNDLQFTPDGKQLIISGDVDSTQHPDRALESQVFIADADGANLRLLLGEKDKNFTGSQLSPSGKRLAFMYGATATVSIPQLGIMPLNGTVKDILTIPFDRNIAGLKWSNDEKYIYFTAQSNGGIPLYRIELATKKIEQLSDYSGGMTSFDLVNKTLVFAKTEPANPSELYIADAAAKNIRRVSSFNYDWVSKKKLSFPEKKIFTNTKGQQVEYWMMKPAGFEAGKKYPVILDIHGGPTAMWGPGESSMWHEFQFYCSRGYGVVYCNPRGSGGYGADFLRSNINDWGAGPTSDVLTALDKTVGEGWADTSRMAVTGGSYAGYLVAWIIGHDKRFKAACAQRGVYDLGTFFGEGNAWRLVPNYFGGYPWEASTKAIIERESPINYVQNITTPFLIFHGETDLRTGVIQSEMLYKSLKVLGRPVEYVRHPGATHELTRSGNNRQRIDQMLRTYEFFERWLREK